MLRVLLVLLLCLAPYQTVRGRATSGPTRAEESSATVSVEWGKVTRTSKTTATLQVVVNPMLRRGSPIHDQAFEALHNLKADYVRYVPWQPYPKLGVAELQPPENGKTFWDFALVDPLTVDFLAATAGHPVVLNFSIIPQWMFRTPQPVSYPHDPNQVTWDYQQGSVLRDSSMKELGDYYARLVGWYTQGGFKDELGQWHTSDHHYELDFWEVLNEVDFEHTMTPEQYSARYDAIVEAIRRVAPHMKFVGLALAAPSKNPEFFEYFLNPEHHKAGIPLDMISYHFYASPTLDQTLEAQQFTFFEQADHFLDVVRYIEAIRQRLAPKTGTMINEIGAIAAEDGAQGQRGYVFKPIPDAYWNLCAALYAYLYAQLARQGIDTAGESQLVGYPSQFPSVTMIDWTTGKPNARYWALKLLRDHFGPGDKLVETDVNVPYVLAQGFVARDGQSKILLVNKRDRAMAVSIPGVKGARVDFVDETTGFNPPRSTRLAEDQVSLPALAVAVVTRAP